MKQPIYFIDVYSEGCDLLSIVNGFPALRISTPYITNTAQPLNLYLIGKNNKVQVKLTPYYKGNDPELIKDSISKIKAHGKIKIYKPTEISSPDNGEVLMSFNFDGSVGGVFGFDNIVQDFSGLLLNSVRIENREQILDYGLNLFNLFKKEKVSKYAKEFYPKIKDYAIAYYGDENYLRKEFELSYKKEFYKYPGDRESLTKAEIQLKPWCEERIYEVCIIPDLPLLSNYGDAEKSSTLDVSVFVAYINGELKVVR